MFGKNVKPKDEQQETPHKPSLEITVTKNWPVPFKHFKVMRGKERLRNCPRLKEIKEIWQPDVMCDPGFGPWFRKKALMGQLTKFE